MLTNLAEIEIEQEKTEVIRRKAVIHKHSATKASKSTGTPGEDSVQANMDMDKDLIELMDEEMKEIDDDDEGTVQGRVEKVSYTKLQVC